MASKSAANGDAGRLPDFVIIGAMRAGSTSLARYLGAHPDVFMPARKELHFFDWNWDRGVEWYRGHFREAAPEMVAGEATPIYVVYGEAMERLAATCPDLKLIVVLRDPVGRAYSHYWYNRMLDFETLGFREALEAEKDRRPAMTDRRTFDYVERGRYLAQLKRVRELYPRRALHVLLLEELNRRPEETYQATCRFLGVDDTFMPSNIGQSLNTHAAFRSKALAKIARSLPEPFRRTARRLNRKEIRYPPMPADVRAELEGRFAQDNEALAAWLGRDLSLWTRTGDSERPASSARAE